ncbi:MAG TPA: nickel-dependent hydrogenase large subunit [Dongiaceae bacterium]|nr:nickel-dependent hydrogenase large subunit [Dongiaceae bacterium]
MSYRIPIGPYHPALEEPYKVNLVCNGERVCDAELSVGFNFRGIEYLAERRNFVQVIALMERVCGICSNVHTLSICQALERLAEIDPPPRALYIRVIVAELERLHSHILWAGVAGKLMGFKTMFMTCFLLREKVMSALEIISGNRVNYAMNRIGGVNRDIADPQSVLAVVDFLEREVNRVIIPVFASNRTVLERCAGVGVLTREQAKAYGVVGPTARASGVPQDMRRAAPYAAYGEMKFEVPLELAGDVRARLLVRALETIESCRILRQALNNLPTGDWWGPTEEVEVPAGTGISRVEGPRGEVLYSVTADGENDTPRRVKVRTPTYINMPSVRLMLRGARLADAPLIQASIDPCYSCTDR